MSGRPPKMRGLMAVQIKRNIIGALLSGVLGGAIYKMAYVNPKHQHIKDYYRDYDPQASIDAMSEHLQSTGFKQI